MDKLQLHFFTEHIKEAGAMRFISGKGNKKIRQSLIERHRKGDPSALKFLKYNKKILK